ncbi:hypothetical protein DSM101010T_07700 [Desulfovibrio subterraneus]|uniref:Uncharacterized protein n=1 Tax=Desulfovibrio subterraneus TaxID=2718620 RepID=A0A7J0BH30_9BACT|nr:hypothetical protein DSM101010T_07700 [Desulfovibrio subterraneus]
MSSICPQKDAVPDKERPVHHAEMQTLSLSGTARKNPYGVSWRASYCMNPVPARGTLPLCMRLFTYAAL